MASSGGGGIQFDPAELEQEPYDPGKGYLQSSTLLFFKGKSEHSRKLSFIE